MQAQPVPEFESVFQPLKVGEQTLRNRIVLPAHRPSYNTNLKVTQRYVDYHRARARGGAAMQATGVVTPIPQGQEVSDEFEYLANIDDSIIPSYQRAADAVHAEGGKFLGQLGVMANITTMVGKVNWGPSVTMSEVSRLVTHPMTDTEIRWLIKATIDAAHRCIRGGLDGVEILAYAGTLFQQFLSPLTNRRADDWGGDTERRIRLVQEILSGIRARIGTAPILGIKLTTSEFVPGGIDIDMAVEIAQKLTAAGHLDYIECVVGTNLVRESHHRDRWPTGATHGEFRSLARAVKEAVDIPVGYIGGVTGLDHAEGIIDSGDADFVGMARAQLADPDMVRKSAANETARIRPCVHLNLCLTPTPFVPGAKCGVNPETGAEGSWDWISLAVEKPRDFAVVGAGPAGAEAALRLSKRGHHVSLFDSATEIGGQLRHWSSSERFKEFRKLTSYWTEELTNSTVDLRLGKVVTAEDLASMSPDQVVLATGGKPVAGLDVPIDPATTVKVVSPWDVFGQPVYGKTAVVMDRMGQLDAIAIAARLQETFERVVLVTTNLHAGEGEFPTVLYPTIMWMNDAGIEVVPCAQIESIGAHDVTLAGRLNARVPGPIEAVDLVVDWSGLYSDESLQPALEAAGLDAIRIGDALSPRRVQDAIADGAALALASGS